MINFVTTLFVIFAGSETMNIENGDTLMKIHEACISNGGQPSLSETFDTYFCQFPEETIEIDSTFLWTS